MLDLKSVVTKTPAIRPPSSYEGSIYISSGWEQLRITRWRQRADGFWAAARHGFHSLGGCIRQVDAAVIHDVEADILLGDGVRAAAGPVAKDICTGRRWQPEWGFLIRASRQSGGWGRVTAVWRAEIRQIT